MNLIALMDMVLMVQFALTLVWSVYPFSITKTAPRSQMQIDSAVQVATAGFMTEMIHAPKNTTNEITNI